MPFAVRRKNPCAGGRGPLAHQPPKGSIYRKEGQIILKFWKIKCDFSRLKFFHDLKLDLLSFDDVDTIVLLLYRLFIARIHSCALGIREAFSDVKSFFFDFSPPGGFQRLKMLLIESRREGIFLAFNPVWVSPGHAIYSQTLYDTFHLKFEINSSVLIHFHHSSFH